MSRLNVQTHLKLLKEARKYLKDVKPASDIALEEKKGAIVLTQDHLVEWLQVFEEDRIKLDGCNFAVVKR
jgi:hypothetical protein